MTSNNDYDRLAVLHDFKQRMIDLTEQNFIAPEVGIYDEPVRYLKINLQWFKFLAGALSMLEHVAYWKEAQDHTYRGIQEFLKFEEGIELPAPTFPEGGDCASYPLSSIFIDYEPQDPFNSPDFIPPDYLVPPFLLNDELEYPEILGYQATDVFVPFGAVNIDPINLATFNLPRLILSIKGSGQIELDFLAVAFGGIVVTKVGEMPNILDIVIDNVFDTGIQIIDLEVPTGTIAHAGNVLRSVEINIEAEPEEITNVYIVFSPKVNDSIIPIAFGGGIRSIQLCAVEGEGSVVGLEDIRFNPETCTLEKRIGGIWSDVENWEALADCLGVTDMATQAEITQAVVDAGLELMSRAIAGEGGNTVAPTIINKDGTWEKGSAGVDVDDPETELDEGAMSIMGAAIHISKALEVLYDKLDQYYGNTNNSPITSDITVTLYLSLYFPVNEATFGDAVQDYYAYRVTNNRLLWDTSETQQNVMYCQGANATGWNKWLIDYSGFVADKIAVMSALSNALAPEFWTSYFEAGAKLPSTQYLDAPCVPIAPQELVGFTFDVARSTGIVKANHRMKIRYEGYATDADGDIHDWFWYREEPSGVTTWQPPTITFAAGGNVPSQIEVAYVGSHIYEATLDLANLANNPIQFEVNKHANFNAVGMTQNVPFKVTLTDLGQHTII